MTNGKSPDVLRGIMSLGSGTLLTLVCSFVSISISARALSEDQYGVYFLLLTIVYLLEVICNLGLRSSAAKFIASAQNDDERQAIVNSVLTFRLLMAVGVSLLAVICKPLILLAFPSDLLSRLFLYVPVLFCVQTADLLLDCLMQGFQLYRKMAFVKGMSGVLNLGLVVLFLLPLDLSLEGLILATALSVGITALVRYWMIPGHKALMLDTPLLRRMIRFGLPLQSNDVLTFISQRLDILILGAMVSPKSVAYLGVASKIPQNLQRLFASLYSVYFPHMSNLFGQDQRVKAKNVMNRFLRLTAFITVSGALFTVLFQDEIITLVFSEKYLPSAPALGLLMIIFTLSVASTILDHTLIAADHPDYLPVISLADTVPSVIANLLLIPPLGFMGAVYAKLIANICTNPVSVWALLREKISVRVGAYLKPMLFMVICLGIYFGLGWDSLVIKSALLALFVVLSMAFSVITPTDLLTMFENLKPERRQPVFDK
ncbi:MAG: flippase [Anaerolineae bacterium]|nr:flippase [Anaerolineae bacterium]